MLLDNDKELKAKLDKIMNEYEGKDILKEEKEKYIKQEIVHLAKATGYEFVDIPSRGQSLAKVKPAASTATRMPP